ncbi:MAG: 4-hydroxy-tetrahydrodipicolinate reductase [Candidatus Omnitrophica bacterium]|nr:4-hydroxy-tetrahydrodipicolinate reductase [Candidatus Omnitrophota bacterium]
MIKLAISGCHGRMGQAICKLAFNEPNTFTVKTLLEHKDHPKVKEQIHSIVPSITKDCLAGCDVLIEFTLPEPTMEALDACVKHKVKMVIGTTGLTPEQIKKIEQASKHIAIVYSSNMSIGVNVMFKLIEMASEKLGPLTSEINITETHHIHKKDAPSGTAKTMLQFAEKFSGKKVNPIESIREGEVVGYHKITFETNEDTLSIIHNAKDRTMFAKGALEAAKFLMTKNQGLFNMKDVLNLN